MMFNRYSNPCSVRMSLTHYSNALRSKVFRNTTG